MHATFGNHLAVEMCQLLNQPDVLEQCRTARAGRLNVGVVNDGRAGSMGHGRGAVSHGVLLFPVKNRYPSNKSGRVQTSAVARMVCQPRQADPRMTLQKLPRWK